MIVTPYYSRYYLNAEHEPMVPYLYAMNMASMVGDILLFSFLLLLSLVVSAKIVLTVGLIVAIPASYAIRWIRTSEQVS